MRTTRQTLTEFMPVWYHLSFHKLIWYHKSSEQCPFHCRERLQYINFHDAEILPFHNHSYYSLTKSCHPIWTYKRHHTSGTTSNWCLLKKCIQCKKNLTGVMKKVHQHTVDLLVAQVWLFSYYWAPICNNCANYATGIRYHKLLVI